VTKQRSLEIEQVPVSKLKYAEWNPRTISEHQMKALCRSLGEFGAVDPAVINRDCTIIGGHQRVRAATELGWTHYPCVRLDLPLDKAKALNIALNKIAGEWDEPLLAQLLAEIQASEVEVDLTGFEDDEIARLMASIAAEYPAGIDEIPELPKKPRTKRGQLWLLGEHRLLAGDATSADDVARLLAGEQAEMVWTDPPYGVAIGDKNRYLNSVARSNRVEENLVGDTLTQDELLAMLRAAFGHAAAHCARGAAWYVAAPAGPLHLLWGQALNELGIWHQTIQWVKNNATFSPLGVDYHWQAEPIFYGWLPGARHHYHGGRKQTTVWEIDRPGRSPEHPTMKPVELVARAIQNSTKAGEAVLDPFCGSGTTLCAAEQLGRRCYAMELEPRYVQVVIERWQNLSGRDAVLEETGEPFARVGRRA